MIRYPNYGFNRDFKTAATACRPYILDYLRFEYEALHKDELYLMLSQHSCTSQFNNIVWHTKSYLNINIFVIF